MNSTVPAASISVMFNHLRVLRNYARRSILLEQILPPHEEQDRDMRLKEFFATGHSLNWTQKEMATLLLREVFSNS